MDDSSRPDRAGVYRFIIVVISGRKKQKIAATERYEPFKRPERSFPLKAFEGTKQKKPHDTPAVASAARLTGDGGRRGKSARDS